MFRRVDTDQYFALNVSFFSLRRTCYNSVFIFFTLFIPYLLCRVEGIRRRQHKGQDEAVAVGSWLGWRQTGRHQRLNGSTLLSPEISAKQC